MAEEIVITLVSDVIIYINESDIVAASAFPVETDPTVPAWVKDITEQDIINWNAAGGGGLDCASLAACATIVAIQASITSLQTAINDEVTARTLADITLQGSINTVAGNLLNEEVSRISQDNLLDTRITNEIAALLDGVASPGDTLQKLYNLIIAGVHEVIVANIAARNAYNVPSLPFSIFVTDDGDGNWAKYQAITTGVGATFVKLSDPDLLNAAMSASAIKAAYESNPDTNAFTNALLAKLNGIAAGATANSSDATLLNRANHTGTQLAATISDFAATVLATVLTGLSTATNAVITASDSVLSALGKLQKQISDNLTTLTNHVATRKILVKASDQSTTTSGSLVDVTTLVFPLAANEVWFYDILLYITCSATNGMKVGLTVPALATLMAQVAGDNTLASNHTQDIIIASATGTSTNFINYAATKGRLRITGIVNNGANAGSLQLQYHTGNVANTVTIKANSHLIAEKV